MDALTLSDLGDKYWSRCELGSDAKALLCWRHAASGTPLTVSADASVARDVNSKDCKDACASACCAHRPGHLPGSSRGPAITKRVGIIGGGPSGLCVLKECLEKGFECMLFEAESCIGGVFSSAYEDATLTSSSCLTALLRPA